MKWCNEKNDFFRLMGIITRFFASVIIQKVNMKLLLIISLLYFLDTIGLTFVNDSIGFSMLTILVFTISSNIVPKSRWGHCFFRIVYKCWDDNWTTNRNFLSCKLFIPVHDDYNSRTYVFFICV